MFTYAIRGGTVVEIKLRQSRAAYTYFFTWTSLPAEASNEHLPAIKNKSGLVGGVGWLVVGGDDENTCVCGDAGEEHMVDVGTPQTSKHTHTYTRTTCRYRITTHARETQKHIMRKEEGCLLMPTLDRWAPPPASRWLRSPGSGAP